MDKKKLAEVMDDERKMINSIFVPNEINEGAKILCIGESPGDTEEYEKRPFVGESGQLLTSTFARYGLSREQVSFANLSNYRPQGNKFEHLIGSKELQEGSNEVLRIINVHKPQLIVPLGAQPLKFLLHKPSIHAWRGSILSYEGIKTIPTFHPAAVVRDRTLLPIFDGDVNRIVSDSNFPDLRLPQRKFVIDPKGLELEEYVQLLCNSERISVDIESVKESTHILCVGFSPSPDLGICIVHRSDAETQNAISRILTSPAKKIFHFGTFDTEMLHLNGYEIANYHWDTLTAQHVLNAELPRGLDFLTSIYTREPYYKASGRGEIPGDTKSWGSKVDKEKLWIYNCRDVCVTIEIQLEQEKELTEENDKRVFDHEMKLIPAGQLMSRAGMLCDIERRDTFDKALRLRWMKLQLIMNQLCGGRHINVKSPKLKDLLYDEFKLPVKRGKNGKVTTDEDAIVALIGYTLDHYNSMKTEKGKSDWRVKLLVLKTILEIRGIRTLLSNFVNAPISADNRFHSIYKFASTETGRAACEGYVDGTGVNAQTFSRGNVEVPEGLENVEAPVFDLSDEPEDTEDEPAEQGALL